MPEPIKGITTMKNVHFYYSYVDVPQVTKNAKDKGIQFDAEDPKANTEWVIKVAFPEKTFKAMKKKWKNCTNFSKAKDYSLEEFEQAFHIRKDDAGKETNDGLMPDFGKGVEDVVLVKFAQKARSKAGKDHFPPKLIGIKGKVQDNNGVEINQETLIGNASKGHLQLREVDFKENGLYLYPNAICITDLVVWEGGGDGKAVVDEDAFGIEELDEADLDSMDLGDDDLDTDDDADDMF